MYHGSRTTALAGKYIYADFASGNVWALTFDGDKKAGNQLLLSGAGTISAFGEDTAGEVYLLDHGGPIKRFTN